MKRTSLTKEALNPFSVRRPVKGSELDDWTGSKIRTTEVGLAFWALYFHELLKIQVLRHFGTYSYLHSEGSVYEKFIILKYKMSRKAKQKTGK